jgi:hypothetical protein
MYAVMYQGGAAGVASAILDNVRSSRQRAGAGNTVLDEVQEENCSSG